MRVILLLVLSSAFGRVLEKRLEGLESRRRIETIQTTPLMRSVRVLRRVKQTWWDLKSFTLHWKITNLHWSQKYPIIIIIIIIITMQTGIKRVQDWKCLSGECDPLGIVQEIHIWPYTLVVSAQTRIRCREWDIQGTFNKLPEFVVQAFKIVVDS